MVQPVAVLVHCNFENSPMLAARTCISKVSCSICVILLSCVSFSSLASFIISVIDGIVYLHTLINVCLYYNYQLIIFTAQSMGFN